MDRISRVWLVQEPFSIGPFGGFNGVAHTYFVFDFEDQPPVAISVEARRERGEAFNVLRGLLNQFELIYIWASEQDVTVRRAIVEQRELYMYPLTISVEAERTLFLQLAEASRDLESHPRFYNTLTNNCTSELARAANRVKPGAIPPNIALVFPGYSDELLYERGVFPNDVSLDQLTRRYAISDIVRATYEREDFSRALRMELASRE